MLLKRKYEKFKLAGEICIASYNRVFPSYENVRNLVRKHNIKGRADWKRYRLAHVSLNLPSDPQNTYKNKGWVNWTTFVGLRFLGFVDARKYVRSLGLKKYRDWKKYSASNRRIKNIPSCPWTVYNKEWKGLHDWLGINI